jgi:transposase
VKDKIREFLKFRRNVFILKFARLFAKPIAICRKFDIHKSTFYAWEKIYDKKGIDDLRYKKGTPKSHHKKNLKKSFRKPLN